jgi:transposase
VLGAERMHGDDTTVPVLAKGKTDTGRIWVYMRDDKPFVGPERPGAVFYYSRDRAGEQSPEKRKAVRQALSAPLVADLEAWMREQRAKPSRANDVAKAMDYMLKRWAAFTRFLEDGRICRSNNAAERGVRGIALGRKFWLFCGSDHGGQRAALMYSLIVTAKMNDVDPQAWLADILARIAEHPVQRLDELLPWNWGQLNVRASQAA